MYYPHRHRGQYWYCIEGHRRLARRHPLLNAFEYNALTCAVRRIHVMKI
jgi:hypothetical protein